MIYRVSIVAAIVVALLAPCSAIARGSHGGGHHGSGGYRIGRGGSHYSHGYKTRSGKYVSGRYKKNPRSHYQKSY